MAEKRVGKSWFYYGRKSGFGIGFEFNKYGWSMDLLFWYIGQDY